MDSFVLLPKAVSLNRQSTSFLPSPNIKKILVELNYDLWLKEPTDIVIFGFERSFDNGKTWEHWVSATTHSGKLDKENKPPWLMTSLYQNGTFQVRGFIKSNARVLGLTANLVEGTRVVLADPTIPRSWADTGRKVESAGGGSNSVQVTLNSTAAGSLITVGTACYTSGTWPGDITVIAVSDGINGAYSAAFFKLFNRIVSGLNYFANNAGGNLTITSDPDGTASAIWVAVHEFSGGATTSPLSGTPATASGYSATIASGSFAPADNDVLLLAVGTNESNTTIAENAGSEGFTLSNELESAWDVSSLVFKIISGAPGTVSHTWTAGGIGNYSAGIAAFKPSAAGGLSIPGNPFRKPFVRPFGGVL